MRYLYFAFLGLFLTSCTQKWCSIHYPGRNDTIRIETIRDSIVIKDTTIYIHLPGQTVHDSVVIPCPEIPGYVPKRVYAETQLAKASAWWSFPNIKLELIQKDTTIVKRLEGALREAYYWKTEYEKINHTPAPVKFIPGVYKIALWLWVGVLIAIAGYVAFRLIKR